MRYLKTTMQLQGVKEHEVSYIIHQLHKEKIKNHWMKDEPEIFEDDEQDEFLFGDGG